MRVTNRMLTETTLTNLNSNRERLDRLQDQLTSSQRISNPSDDPIGISSALEFRSTISEIDQYLRNVDAANSWLGATDTALGAVNDTLHRARELAVQGANDTLSADDRQSIVTEVSNLIEATIGRANSTYAGQYIFAGVKVGTTPFSPVGNPPTAITYNGDGGAIARQINNQATMVVNSTGNTVFGPVFTALIGLRDALTSGSAGAVAATILDIDGALNSVISARAQAGARMNRLVGEQNRLESLKLDLAGLLSKIQDVDITSAISEFALQQSVYEAALAAGAKAITPSLLDYLK